jgi:hypothetical protein
MISRDFKWEILTFMHGLSAVTIEGQLLQPPCAPDNANGHQLLKKREEDKRVLIRHFIKKAAFQEFTVSRMNIELGLHSSLHSSKTNSVVKDYVSLQNDYRMSTNFPAVS